MAEEKRAMALPKTVEFGRQSITEAVAKELVDLILAPGSYRAGDRLPSERQLAEALGVGRSVVREALKSLAIVGLVEVKLGNGTFVATSTSEFLTKAVEWGLVLGQSRVTDLIEAREEFEVAAAGLCASRRTPEDLAELVSCLAAMHAAKSVDDFVQADLAFHFRVAMAGGNYVLANILTSVRSLAEVWMRKVVEAEGKTPRSVAEHEFVLKAIEAGNDDLAREAMRSHMNSAGARLANAVSPDGLKIRLQPSVTSERASRQQ